MRFQLTYGDQNIRLIQHTDQIKAARCKTRLKIPARYRKVIVKQASGFIRNSLHAACFINPRKHAARIRTARAIRQNGNAARALNSADNGTRHRGMRRRCLLRLTLHEQIHLDQHTLTGLHDGFNTAAIRKDRIDSRLYTLSIIIRAVPERNNRRQIRHAVHPLTPEWLRSRAQSYPPPRIHRLLSSCNGSRRALQALHCPLQRCDTHIQAY